CGIALAVTDRDVLPALREMLLEAVLFRWLGDAPEAQRKRHCRAPALAGEIETACRRLSSLRECRLALGHIRIAQLLQPLVHLPGIGLDVRHNAPIMAIFTVRPVDHVILGGPTISTARAEAAHHV